MNILLQGKGCPQPRVTSLWVMPKRPTSRKQEEGPGGHPCSQGAGKPSCFIQRTGGGDGCGRRFPGAFYCAVFSTFTSRTSEAVSLGGSQSKQTVSWTQRICAKGLVWLLPTCAWTPLLRAKVKSSLTRAGEAHAAWGLPLGGALRPLVATQRRVPFM